MQNLPIKSGFETHGSIQLFSVCQVCQVSSSLVSVVSLSSLGLLGWLGRLGSSGLSGGGLGGWVSCQADSLQSTAVHCSPLQLECIKSHEALLALQDVHGILTERYRKHT